MAGRDDGEFELILGNKQLLSVLFIVIVLLGVFFAMGFLAGRSTGPTVAARKDADQIPISVDAASTRSIEAATPAPVAEAATQPPAAQPAAAPTDQTPIQPPAPQAKPEAAKPEAAKPAAPPPAKPVETPKPQQPASGFVQTPPSGTYLQAAAIRRADAESMLAYIGEKTKLRGFVTPVPKSSDNFRVIVGPLATNDDMASARTKLADIGIKTPYPVKY